MEQKDERLFWFNNAKGDTLLQSDDPHEVHLIDVNETRKCYVQGPSGQDGFMHQKDMRPARKVGAKRQT